MLQPGDIVGRHRVELVLGEGGAATVYRVRHTVLGTLHALKVLHVVHPDLRERLLEEGRIQARLRHPHILSVHDVLTVSESPALLMDFVVGGTLASRLSGSGMDRETALARFTEVVEGVAHAHADGVLHRDLHPGNVLLDDSSGSEIAVVSDFGIARVLDEGSARRTRTGVAMGTPAYMAPEQAAGSKDTDARADIFSLGVMLYRLMTGRLPFEDEDAVAALLAAREGRWTPPGDLVPDLSPVLCRVIERLLRPGRPVAGLRRAARRVAKGGVGFFPRSTGAGSGEARCRGACSRGARGPGNRPAARHRDAPRWSGCRSCGPCRCARRGSHRARASGGTPGPARARFRAGVVSGRNRAGRTGCSPAGHGGRAGDGGTGVGPSVERRSRGHPSAWHVAWARHCGCDPCCATRALRAARLGLHGRRGTGRLGDARVRCPGQAPAAAAAGA